MLSSAIETWGTKASADLIVHATARLITRNEFVWSNLKRLYLSQIELEMTQGDRELNVFRTSIRDTSGGMTITVVPDLATARHLSLPRVESCAMVSIFKYS